jgi:hypothetical protein
MLDRYVLLITTNLDPHLLSGSLPHVLDQDPFTRPSSVLRPQPVNNSTAAQVRTLRFLPETLTLFACALLCGHLIRMKFHIDRAQQRRGYQIALTTPLLAAPAQRYIPLAVPRKHRVGILSLRLDALLTRVCS